MSVFVAAIDQLKPNRFKAHRVSAKRDYEFIWGEIDVDTSSPNYPNRSDLKIMRSDVVASILLTRSLIDNLTYQPDLESAGLFVASGVFIENSDDHLNHVIQLFEEYEKTHDATERMRKLYRASPPLLALQTLTNSSMSFISQYTGIRGNNATYGTSSQSGYYALKHAYDDAFFDGKNSFVCATNCAGPQSFLMNLPFAPYSSDWTECSSVSTLLISPENLNGQALAKIVSLTTTTCAQELNGKFTLPETLFTSCGPQEIIIFSGAFTSEQNTHFQNQIEARNIQFDSSFKPFGNLGPVNLLSGIQRAISLLKASNSKRFHAVDIDVYGRIAHAVIEPC